MLTYVVAEVHVRLRLRQKPVPTSDEEVNEQFVHDLIEGCLEPDEQILEFECAIVPEETFREVR